MIEAKFEDEINDLVTENLYQWDTYQTLKITGIDFGSVTPRVHFCNKKSNEALVVTGVLKSDGSAEVSIPNSLLTEKYDVLAYVYTNTGLTYKTIKSITIPLIGRLKPSAYTQPSNEDIAEIEEIELEAKAIIDGLYPSVYSETAKYKRPNIVYYEGNAYLCKSGVEITGVLPTDTSKWQQITDTQALLDSALELESASCELTTELLNANHALTADNATNATNAINATKATTADYTSVLKNLTSIPVEHYMYADVTKLGLYVVTFYKESGDKNETILVNFDSFDYTGRPVYEFNYNNYTHKLVLVGNRLDIDTNAPSALGIDSVKLLAEY